VTPPYRGQPISGFLGVESVTPVDPFTLLVGLDNNHPGGNGRVPGTPDATEIITLRAKQPLLTRRVTP
jgi:hypothetical protein